MPELEDLARRIAELESMAHKQEQNHVIEKVYNDRSLETRGNLMHIWFLS